MSQLELSQKNSNITEREGELSEGELDEGSEKGEFSEEDENKAPGELFNILPGLKPGLNLQLQERLKTIEKEILLYQNHELWKQIYDEERLPVIMKYLNQLKQYTLWPDFYNLMLEIVITYRSFLRNHNYVVGDIVFTIEAELDKMSPTFDKDRMEKILKLVSSVDDFEKLSIDLMGLLTCHQLENHVIKPQNMQTLTEKLSTLDLTIATLIKELI